ncbi:MAG: hypothetical protein ACLFPF_06290 [Halanaerobiales bacterium]
MEVLKEKYKDRCQDRYVLIILLVISMSLLLLLSSAAEAEVTIGGKVKATLTGIIAEEDGSDSQLSESLDLELFIPPVGDTDVKVQFVINNPETRTMSGSSGRFDFKKLYLKHKFSDFYLTVGRQPISWSFGSLLNPVDFSLGAVALEQESMGKYQDAVELYYPFNWNSSLEVIAADTRYGDDFKWALRGRTGISGYDITLNYIKESASANPISGILPIGGLIGRGPDGQGVSLDRYGLTAKGDLGPIGAYTAVGYYDMEGGGDPSYAYLLGGDYSFTYDYNKKITMQLEYLGLQDDAMIKQLESVSGEDIGRSLDLMMGYVNYPIDDFSSIGLIAVASLDDGSTVLMPVYENQLPGNIKLSLRTSIFTGDEWEMLSSQGINAGYELSLSYTF